jgi:hypothetical protein
LHLPTLAPIPTRLPPAEGHLRAAIYCAGKYAVKGIRSKVPFELKGDKYVVAREGIVTGNPRYELYSSYLYFRLHFFEDHTIRICMYAYAGVPVTMRNLVALAPFILFKMKEFFGLHGPYVIETRV